MRVELLTWELLLILPFFHFFSYAIFFVLFFLVEPQKKAPFCIAYSFFPSLSGGGCCAD